MARSCHDRLVARRPGGHSKRGRTGGRGIAHGQPGSASPSGTSGSPARATSGGSIRRVLRGHPGPAHTIIAAGLGCLDGVSLSIGDRQQLPHPPCRLDVGLAEAVRPRLDHLHDRLEGLAGLDTATGGPGQHQLMLVVRLEDLRGGHPVELGAGGCGPVNLRVALAAASSHPRDASSAANDATASGP
jgi:hypothetical protein